MLDLPNQEFSYLSFYNLREPPFSLVPVPHIFYPSHKHVSILDILKFSILNGSLISVIIGEPGVGKTQALITLLAGLPEKNFTKIEIHNPALSPEELIKSIFYALQLELPADFLNKNLVLKVLKESLAKNLNDSKRKILLVIDEAQLLPDDTMEELRLITNLNEGTEPVIQILLVGQLALRERLMEKKFFPLRQRISVLEELKPIDKDEVLPYIWFRINQVSTKPEINIHKNVHKIIYKLTKGNPRLINKIMDRSLFIAYIKQENLITKEHIKEAKATFEELLFK